MRWMSFLATGLIGMMSIPVLAGSPPGYALAAQTAHISFYVSQGLDLSVAASKTESFLQDTAARLGVPLDDARVDYYRHPRQVDVAAETGVYATGVARPGVDDIHSVLDYHPHEVVHIISAKLGRPGAFFDEGLAVALGDRGKRGGVSVDTLAKNDLGRVELASVLNTFDRVDPQVSYPIAGSFVRYLIKLHGLPKVVQFFRACHAGPSARDTAFASVFGAPVNEALSTWAASL
jgi:hypothetical protein